MQKKHRITATGFGIVISLNVNSSQPDRGTCLQGHSLVFGGLSVDGAVWEWSLFLTVH